MSADLILQSADGYSVSADQVPRKAEAARALIEEEVGTPADWRGILRIARALTGPTMLRQHVAGETADGICGCEDDGWWCNAASGPPVGRYWWSEGGVEALEDAAWAYAPEGGAA
jgi:hypothetical protein